MSKRVVITGQGTVTAFGESWDENKTKICELKNDRWHNFAYYKPSDEKKYLVVTKDMEIEVAEYEPKDFEFKGYDVVSWRELPLANDVIARIQKNPFGFGRKKNDKQKNK